MRVDWGEFGALNGSVASLASDVLPPERWASIGLLGDARTVLSRLPGDFVQTTITSPPYWGLRDYGATGQIGLEDDPRDYVATLAAIFTEVHRVTRSDGTLWLNLGDSYTSGGRKWRDADRKNPVRAMDTRPPTPEGLKPKDLVGIPWLVAFALQDAGWYLRSDIVWNKPNCMPESVKDRPTRSHEYLFLFSKSERYVYDNTAVRGENDRNLRTVWNVPTRPFPGAHFATFPPELIRPCVALTSKRGDVILDPFFGSGTVGIEAARQSRRFLGIELQPAYLEIARRRFEAEATATLL